jgi:hypothetical protein
MAKQYSNDTAEQFVIRETDRRNYRLYTIAKFVHNMDNAVAMLNAPTSNNTIAAQIAQKAFERNQYGPTTQEIQFNPIQVPVPPEEVKDVAEVSGAIATEAFVEEEPVTMQPDVIQQVADQPYDISDRATNARATLMNIFDDVEGA